MGPVCAGSASLLMDSSGRTRKNTLCKREGGREGKEGEIITIIPIKLAIIIS